MDVLEVDTFDRDSISGLASRSLVAVVLLDDNGILPDVLEGDVFVCDIGHGGGSGIIVGLDANTILGSADGAVDNIGTSHNLVALDGSNGNTVASNARVVREGDIGSRVEG